MSVHGQSDPDLRSAEQIPAQQEEDLQGSHGGGIRLSGGLLPGHEVKLLRPGALFIRLITASNMPNAPESGRVRGCKYCIKQHCTNKTQSTFIS